MKHICFKIEDLKHIRYCSKGRIKEFFEAEPFNGNARVSEVFEDIPHKEIVQMYPKQYINGPVLKKNYKEPKPRKKKKEAEPKEA